MAVLLLAVQSTFGIALCPNRYAFADPFSAGFLCTVQPPVAATDGGTAPAHDPSLDCPFCAAFCHAATVLAPEFVVPDPGSTAAFTNDHAPRATSVTPRAPNSRGPPASSHA